LVPSADIDFFLSRISVSDWVFIGCVGPEKRSLSCFRRVSQRMDSCYMVRIFDQKLPSTAEQEILDLRKREAVELGVPEENISDELLFTTIDRIKAFCKTATKENVSVLLDISSMPKRWFFVLVRELVSSCNLRNLIITYSSAASYAKDLSFDPESARALPGFSLLADRASCDVAFVGLGYHSTGLKSVLELEEPKQIHMFFPFPPALPGMMKNWESARYLEQITKQITDNKLTESGERLSYIQHHFSDVALCFEVMVKITDGGRLTSMGAPYGPKPLSMAMCLFALACEKAGRPEVPLYYSQPTSYSHDYTTDVKFVNGVAEVTAFAVILDGREQFQITNPVS
jgi:hypothetical protein